MFKLPSHSFTHLGLTRTLSSWQGEYHYPIFWENSIEFEVNAFAQRFFFPLLRKDTISLPLAKCSSSDSGSDDEIRTSKITQ